MHSCQAPGRFGESTSLQTAGRWLCGSGEVKLWCLSARREAQPLSRAQRLQLRDPSHTRATHCWRVLRQARYISGGPHAGRHDAQGWYTEGRPAAPSQALQRLLQIIESVCQNLYGRVERNSSGVSIPREILAANPVMNSTVPALITAAWGWLDRDAPRGALRVGQGRNGFWNQWGLKFTPSWTVTAVPGALVRAKMHRGGDPAETVVLHDGQKIFNQTLAMPNARAVGVIISRRNRPHRALAGNHK